MKAAAFERLMDQVNLQDYQKIAMRKAVLTGVDSNVINLHNLIEFPRSDFSLTTETKFDQDHFFITSEIELQVEFNIDQNAARTDQNATS